MRNIFFTIGLMLSVTAFGQNKDTLLKREDSTRVVAVVQDILQYGFDKNIPVKEYSFLQGLINAYIDEKIKMWRRKPETP